MFCFTENDQIIDNHRTSPGIYWLSLDLSNLLKTKNPRTGTLENKADPEEMPHNAVCGISSESALFAKPNSIFKDFCQQNL